MQSQSQKLFSARHYSYMPAIHWTFILKLTCIGFNLTILMMHTSHCFMSLFSCHVVVIADLLLYFLYYKPRACIFSTSSGLELLLDTGLALESGLLFIQTEISNRNIQFPDKTRRTEKAERLKTIILHTTNGEFTMSRVALRNSPTSWMRCVLYMATQSQK